MPNFLDRPDGRLAYDINGSGPPLLLVTGLGGSRRYWANVVPALAREFSVITHDHMGIGDSQGTRIAHTVEALADDVVALMDHLGLPQANLLGHSTGAAVGQILAQDHPQRLLKLVLSAGWAGPDPYFELCFAARKSLLQGSGTAAYQRSSAIFLYPPSWISADAARLEALLAGFIASTSPADVLAARIDMIVAFDRRSRRKEIAAPTLVICAADDQLTPMHLSEELADGIPRARLVRLAWGGHASSQTAPEDFLNAVLEFLRT
ncbi:aminoacrylate hydrolase [Tardiphaga robiniae]|uniref:alpha/beta fold hydrolase n=1 Tax=Tardiphaga robiniae TaxID=943830 RepID=UPI002854EFA1|nr:alpha/beta fold hydrolase [Tardiphaga robiniae]MDR6661204.1 aminoacrylate hydrolase [Tardiphaga robiniae]